MIMAVASVMTATSMDLSHMHAMLKSHRTQKRRDMHATLACRARQGSVGAESRVLAMSKENFVEGLDFSGRIREPHQK